MTGKLSFLFVLFFSFYQLQAQDFQRLSTHELDHWESEDYNDLAPLNEAIGEASIVMLGEHTHGEGNEFLIKSRLVKFLHEEMGFEILAFESGFYDLWKANKLIKKGEPVEEALKNSLFPIWNDSEQFQPLIKYLEQKQITIAGFDYQLTGDYSLYEMTDELKAFMDEHQLSYDEDAYKQFEDLSDALAEFELPEKFDLQKFNSFKENIQEKLQTVKSKKEVAFWTQNLESLYAHAEDYDLNKPHKANSENWKASLSNGRDKQMAENILYLHQTNPHKKIICWGASAHFANQVQALDNQGLQDYFPAGQHLKNKLGEQQVYNLGFITSGGTYGAVYEKNRKVPKVKSGSIEYYLKSKSTNQAFIDLNKLNSETAFYASAFEYTPVKGKWQDVFDGFIYMDKVSPSENKQATARKKDTNRISGQLSDSETNETIPFAHINIKGTTIGTVSNEQGEFEIKIPEEFQDYALEISSIGYQKTVIEKDTLQSTNLRIQLQPASSLLKAITITSPPENAREMVVRAIKKIPENYPDRALKYSLYYKGEEKSQFTKQKTIAEAAIEAYYSHGYLPDNQKQFNILNKRILQENKKDRQSMIIWPWFGLTAEINEKNDVLNLKALKGYKFEVTDTLQNDSSLVYVVAFECVKTRRKYIGFSSAQSFKGKLYIQETDYAIVKQEETIQFDKRLQKGKSPKQFSFEVHYKKHKQRYYLAFVNFKLIHKRKNALGKQELIEGHHYLVTIKIEPNKPEPLDRHIWEIEKAPYDPSFWAKFNTLYDSELTQKPAIQKSGMQ